MGIRNITIVGGGMAALSAAFELTRTEDLRARHSVTIYQMGWRLGGKGASGRDRDGRVIEHGLHVWFGCYENAFHLLRSAYSEWMPPGGQQIRCWDQALKRQNFTPIGDGDSSDFIQLTWPENEELPGEGSAKLSVWGCIARIIRLAATMYETITSSYPDLQKAAPRISIDLATWKLLLSTGILTDAMVLSRPPLMAGTEHIQNELTPDSWLKVAARWAERVAADQRYQSPEQVRGIVSLLQKNAIALRNQKSFTSIPRGKFIAQTVDVGVALISGVVFDVMFAGIAIADLDRMEFREWLLRNGATRDSVFQSRAVRALYDTMFQYCEGDLRRPSYAAGTAAQAVLRLYGSYKGGYAWEMQSGMGEVVVAPIYKVLKQRGVQFNFFHKLTRIELTPDRSAIKCLHFDQQVKLKDGTYDPTIDPTADRPGLVHWPAMPRWQFIVDGCELCKRGVDFESHWCSEPPVDCPKLEQGVHFDDAILAIPLGAFKQLSAAQGPCDEIIAASDRFRAMTEALVLVPSISVQAWCTRDLVDLGWTCGKPAIVSGPEPLDIWADMSQVLHYENWDASESKPRSLHYFCNVLASQLYRRPPDEVDVPCRAAALARELAVEWLEKKAHFVWPRSVENGEFIWNVLFDPEERCGSDRIDVQVTRANVDPSSCCVASAAGTTEWRLKTDESGVRHLYLAGSWVDTGFSTECIEAAVMSGLQASRAICGSPKLVVGEDFLHSRGLSEFAAIFALVLGGLETLFAILWELSSPGVSSRQRRGGAPSPQSRRGDLDLTDEGTSR